MYHYAWFIGFGVSFVVYAALMGLRGAKSNAKVSMRAELARAEVRGPEALVRAAEKAADDLRKTGKVTGDLVFTVDDAATELTATACLLMLQQVSYLISEEMPLPKEEMAARVADIIYAAFSPFPLP